MKSFLLLMFAFAFGVNAHAQVGKPWLSMDGIQVKSDGSVFSDSKIWKIPKNENGLAVYTSERDGYKNTLEVKKVGTDLKSVALVNGVMEGVFVGEGVHLAFSEGKLVQFLVCDPSECQAGSRDLCDKFAKVAGFSSGQQLMDQEAACKSATGLYG